VSCKVANVQYYMTNVRVLFVAFVKHLVNIQGFKNWSANVLWSPSNVRCTFGLMLVDLVCTFLTQSQRTFDRLVKAKSSVKQP
jgi:hypothetical protein